MSGRSNMDIKDLIKIIDRLEKMDVSEVSVEYEGTKVSLKKNTVFQTGHMIDKTQTAQINCLEEFKPVQMEEGIFTINAPISGVFYDSPAPDKPQFVTEGKKIKKGDVICILETMKLFNEMKAEKSGTVEKILAQNEQQVEAGQALFLCRED